MKKRTVIALVLSAIMAAAIIIPVSARPSHTNDDYVEYAHNGCCFDEAWDQIFAFAEAYDVSPEVQDIIDIGDGYTVYAFSAIGVDDEVMEAILAAQGVTLEYVLGTSSDNSAARVPCVHVGLTSSVVQVFHTVRTNPPPRICTMRTIMMVITCSGCWWTYTGSTMQAEGCGLNPTC